MVPMTHMDICLTLFVPDSWVKPNISNANASVDCGTTIAFNKN